MAIIVAATKLVQEEDPVFLSRGRKTRTLPYLNLGRFELIDDYDLRRLKDSLEGGHYEINDEGTSLAVGPEVENSEAPVATMKFLDGVSLEIVASHLGSGNFRFYSTITGLVVNENTNQKGF